MLDKNLLEKSMLAEMRAVGFVVDGEHAKGQLLASAIAKAVVQHMQTHAEVAVNAGSSAGTYKVQ